MIVKYSISAEDFSHSQRLHRAKVLPRWRRSMRWLVSAWIVIVVCSVSVISVVNKRPILSGTALPLVLCLIYLLALWVVPQYSRKKTFEKDQRLQQEITAQISEDGIHFVTPNSDARTNWGLFVRYLESDRIFVLYQSNQIMNVLPKRFFGPYEVEQFHQLLQQKRVLEMAPSSLMLHL